MLTAPPKARSDESRWKCPNCGRQEGDFILHGDGLVQCMGCNSIYRVTNGDSLLLCREGK